MGGTLRWWWHDWKIPCLWIFTASWLLESVYPAWISEMCISPSLFTYRTTPSQDGLYLTSSHYYAAALAEKRKKISEILFTLGLMPKTGKNGSNITLYYFTASRCSTMDWTSLLTESQMCSFPKICLSSIFLSPLIFLFFFWSVLAYFQFQEMFSFSQ